VATDTNSKLLETAKQPNQLNISLHVVGVEEVFFAEGWIFNEIDSSGGWTTDDVGGSQRWTLVNLAGSGQSTPDAIAGP